MACEDKTCCQQLQHDEQLRSDNIPSASPRTPVDHTATVDHTNVHCTHHSQSAGAIAMISC